MNGAPHAVVIGSGFGGLAAAVRLLARGYRVSVLERRDGPGGRAYVLRRDGFSFDCGPTVVTAPFLLEELWALAGRRFGDEVELRQVTPCYAIRFHDGQWIDFLDDDEAMTAEVRRASPADVDGFRRYMAMSERIFKVGFEGLSDVPFASLGSMLRIAPSMVRLESYRTVYGLVSRFVRDEKLRQVLSFHTLLVGGNPFTTTAIYALISHVEKKWGVSYPKGGIGALVDGLVAIIRQLGGEIRFCADVAEIEVTGGRAQGVRLASGERIAADVVVSNADAAWTYRHLVAASARRRWTDRRVERMRHSMSLFVWYFGTRRTYPDVKHHTILMGSRYRGLLDDIFDRQVLADDFSLYLHRPTATDPSLAPAGHDAFYVLSPVPHLGAGIDWSRTAEPYRRRIEQTLASTVLPDLESNLAFSSCFTPQQFMDELLSLQGAAFGPQPILLQSAYFRPHNKSEDVARLFLVGAGTHPGAGLPGVLSSAKVLDRVLPAARDL